MKLIIAGSRTITDENTVKTAIKDSPYSIDDMNVLLCGMADGVDSIAKELYKDQCKVKEYPVQDYIEDAPNPSVAPLHRNTDMAENATHLLAVWDGKSTGTKDMIKKAKKEDLTIYIHRTDVQNLTDF